VGGYNNATKVGVKIDEILKVRDGSVLLASRGLTTLIVGFVQRHTNSERRTVGKQEDFVPVMSLEIVGLVQ